MTRRAIDPEEAALWHAAMHGVADRRGSKRVAPTSAPPARPAETAPPVATREHRHDPAPRAGQAPAPAAGLDRRQALRLKRGQLPIEARLDLHGMTQAEAHRALAAAIARGHAQGRRVLLVVTGKGTREGSGVLRRAVPRWLGEPAMRERVLATAPALPRDGGDGALYILLRRAR